jgi:hypothetical protein
VITVDASADDRFRERTSVHAMRLRSVIAVPIRSPDGVLGALYLDNRYADARFEAATTPSCSSPSRIRWPSPCATRAHRGAAPPARTSSLPSEPASMELMRGQAVEIDRLQEEVRKRQEALEHRHDYSLDRRPRPGDAASCSPSLDRVIDSPLAVLVMR